MEKSTKSLLFLDQKTFSDTHIVTRPLELVRSTSVVVFTVSQKVGLPNVVLSALQNVSSVLNLEEKSENSGILSINSLFVDDNINWPSAIVRDFESCETFLTGFE